MRSYHLLQVRSSSKHRNIYEFKHLRKKERISKLVHENKKQLNKERAMERYDAHWFLECLLLRIHSSHVYNHFRENKILPLPHPTTLGRMLTSMEC